MISDLECAQNCWNSYHDVSQFEHISFAQGVWCGLRKYDDCIVITFRGSCTLQDWFRDFRACMANDEILGTVESGFMAGLHETAAIISDYVNERELNSNVIITGHSLGAARALLFGGLCTHYKIPCTIVTFGSPRPGGYGLKHLLAPVTVRSYRNRVDPVCEVPLPLPFELYTHPRDLIPLDAMPSWDDPWLGIADHHIELYIKALGQQ